MVPNQWCIKCNKYTIHNTGGCSEHSVSVTKTDNRASDPGVYHCQHVTAKMYNYIYCPDCGRRVN